MNDIAPINVEARDGREQIDGVRATRTAGTLVQASARAGNVVCCELAVSTAQKAVVNEVAAVVFVVPRGCPKEIDAESRRTETTGCGAGIAPAWAAPRRKRAVGAA